LKKAANNDLNIEVHGQKSKNILNGITIRPDIVIEKGWRNLYYRYQMEEH
jgi:5-methylcytosine-specific restriction enzyme subunit McrC